MSGYKPRTYHFMYLLKDYATGKVRFTVNFNAEVFRFHSFTSYRRVAYQRLREIVYNTVYQQLASGYINSGIS